MLRFRDRLTAIRNVAALSLLFASGSGCGWIADTDRIVIATLDGKNITRGMLRDLIYDMPDDERPIIRSRQDYLNVLEKYIDDQIKIPLGQELAAKGEIKVDRDAAREQFFKTSGDKEEEHRHMWSIPTPKPGEEPELMKVYNLTAVDIQRMKDFIEQETDVVVEKLQGEEAVAYLAKKSFEAKELVLDEEHLKMEYELNKENFRSFEQLTILGLQFPAAEPDASTEASKVRARLNAGEDFDTILNEYLQKDIKYGIESVIENNPDMARFKGFWLEASGAVVGDVLGPIFMPDYNRMKRDASGQVVQETVPECWIVFKVLEAKPSEVLPYEKAKGYVAGPVAYASMMKMLRQQHGVEIFEDKVEDPRGGSVDIFGD